MSKKSIEEEVKRLNPIIEWLIYILGYTLILMVVSFIFESFVLENILWAFIAALIIYLLNKTIKPVIFFFTLPITGLTLGLFYPFINVFILYLTSFILTSHFEINNFWISPFIAILIAIMNIFMESITKKITKEVLQ